MEKMKTIRNDDGTFVREFTANGQKYIIRTIEEGIGIKRYGLMKKAQLVSGMGATFENMVKNLQQAIQYYNTLGTQGQKLLDLGIILNNMMRGLVEGSEEKFEFAFWLCTLFIVKPGEPLKVWVEADQKKKIEDWNEEGINEQDFLLLALVTLTGFTSVYKKFKAQLEEQAHLMTDSVATTG